MQADDYYSPLKIFHHREWLDKLRAGVDPPPIFVQLVPTNRCNQDCHFCAYRMSGYSSNERFQERDQLDWDKLKEIVQDCKDMGVKAIELTGGGEPLVHKNFLDLCKLILDSGIDLGLVTNGSVWSDRHTEILSKALWVRFSVDAGSLDTYANMRGSTRATYLRVRDAISSIPKDGPVVGVGFVINHENYKEIEEAADAAFADGADNIRFSAVFQNEGTKYFDRFIAEATASCNRVVEKYRSTRMKVFNLFLDRIGDLGHGPPDYTFCGFQQASTYIGADSNIYRCCVLAYSQRGMLGCILVRRFADVWKSLDFSTFDAHGCPRCMFNAKNRTIAYALNPNPAHVNFP
jgi:MoaA/NifB/PqqE/SkfB family radical SAM enzyme